MKSKYLALSLALVGAGVSKGFAQSVAFTLDHNLFRPPADTQVTTTFSSPYGGSAKLVIYNADGEVIKTLFSGSVSPGAVQTLIWDGKNLSGLEVASGIYVFWLKLDLGVQTKSLVVVR